MTTAAFNWLTMLRLEAQAVAAARALAEAQTAAEAAQSVWSASRRELVPDGDHDLAELDGGDPVLAAAYDAAVDRAQAVARQLSAALEAAEEYGYAGPRPPQSEVEERAYWALHGPAIAAARRQLQGEGEE